MSHSPEHHRKKAEARAEALHHYHHSAIDGKHDDMPHAERMYAEPTKRHPASRYEKDMEEGG